jgi:hypothetical protein
MKTRIPNLVFAICFLIPLFFNVPQANAAPLNDPPTPSPLYEGTIKGNPCAGTMTSAGVLIGANAPVFVCGSFLPIVDALQIPSLIVTGADPKYGLTGIPMAYGYKYEPVASMGKRMDGNTKKRVCFNGGYSRLECYNNYFLWVVVVSGAVDDPTAVDPSIFRNGTTCYGNTCMETNDGSMAVIRNYSFQNGNYWDLGEKMSVEAWRAGGYSTLAGAAPGTGRTRTYLEGIFGVDPAAMGVPSSEIFPGTGARWYMTYSAVNYFMGVMSMTSSKEGSTTTPAGEPAYSLKFKQTWTIFVRQGWSSVDRQLEWTERVCNPDPASTIFNPLPPICNDEDKSKWYNNIGSQNYDSQWQKVTTYNRYKILDRTTGGANGYTDHIAIPYYQAQPLLTDR